MVNPHDGQSEASLARGPVGHKTGESCSERMFFEACGFSAWGAPDRVVLDDITSEGTKHDAE